MAIPTLSTRTERSSLQVFLVSTLLCLVTVVGCAGGIPPDDAGAGGDTGAMGCANATQIFKNRSCSTVCHTTLAAPGYGGFDMTLPGWEKKLVGMGPPDNAPDTNKCKGKGLVYLKKDIQPADGLFMQKLRANPPCGVQMPMTVSPPLPASEMDCVQKWANSIVAGGNGS
jgi:hypothetical protein